MPVVSWPEWQAITLAVVSLIFSLVALAYMIGTGFHLPKLQGWAKDEFYQALASLLLAVLLILFVLTIDTTMLAIYGTNPFDTARGYIFNVAGSLSAYFISLTIFDTFFQIFKSLVMNAMPSQTGFSVSAFIGLSPVTTMLSLAMQAVLGGMALMLAMDAFISFIQTQLSIILPIGIALRAFSFSRPAGGALIAVFLGFYVLFPFLWVFDSYIYTDVSQNIIAYNPMMSAQLLGSNCAQCPMCCTTNTPDFSGNLFVSIINLLAYPAIFTLFIFVLLLPLFNLIVVLIFINELAKIFGSTEIDISGLSGLI